MHGNAGNEQVALCLTLFEKVFTKRFGEDILQCTNVSYKLVLRSDAIAEKAENSVSTEIKLY